MTNVENSKAAGVDKSSVTCLKDGANILAKLNSAFRNLTISLGVLPNVGKVVKPKPIF